jgi:type III pantothenate kinase
MLLAIDIGNTNIVFGVHDGARWTHHWRMQTVRGRTADEHAVIFQGFLREAGLDLGMLEQTVLSSVVPSLTQDIAQMVARRTAHEPLIVRPPATVTGLEIRTEHPDRIGSDLVADAVAAYDYFRSDCIVVDFGTATTFTAVAEPGALLGVAIAAGLNVTADALVSHTAQLSHVALEPPPSVIGRNTIHAMQAGLVLGYVSMVEGIIDRIKAEMGKASVIATGGLSGVIGPLTNRFDAVEPWLTLDGLRLIAERN